MTMQKQTNTSAEDLSKEFGKFLNNYVEAERLCFYLLVKNQNESEPVKILANIALADRNFGLPVFLKKFGLEDNIENSQRLANSFIDLVNNFKSNLQHFDSFKGISREIWNNKNFDGVYVKEDNITLLNFDKIY